MLLFRQLLQMQSLRRLITMVEFRAATVKLAVSYSLNYQLLIVLSHFFKKKVIILWFKLLKCVSGAITSLCQLAAIVCVTGFTLYLTFCQALNIWTEGVCSEQCSVNDRQWILIVSCSPNVSGYSVNLLKDPHPPSATFLQLNLMKRDWLTSYRHFY